MIIPGFSEMSRGKMAYNKSIYTTGTVTYTDADMSFKSNPFSGDLRKKTDVEAIKQALSNLLHIHFGEMPFRPSFGGNLDRLLFEPLDQITMTEIDKSIRNVILNYEPRIQIEKLTIKGKPETHELDIVLIFSMVNTVAPQELNIILKRMR